jgi:hypothetical protein
MTAMKPRYTTLMLMLCLMLLAVMPVLAQDDETETEEPVYDPTPCQEDVDAGDDLSEACLAVIEEFPEPGFEPIPQDRVTLDTYSFWRVGPDPVTTFDGPGGGPIGQIAAGFNFVNAIDLSVEGWLQIEGGAWINRADATYRQASYFSGVLLPEGFEHPVAWVLDLSGIYLSEFPGGEPSAATGRTLRRYELVNIFATAYDDEGWRWYLIGPDQWVKQTFVAKVQHTEIPEEVSGRWVAIDLYEQTLVAYEDDTPVYATLIASGLPGTETNEGIFTVWARLEVDGMSGATGAPNAYALQSVPWVMYFDDSISLHGTYWHDLFGYRQSRGCVNLTISDARYTFQFFAGAEPNEEGEIVNYVYVHSSGVYGDSVIRGTDG